jgi:hypothetical protein
MMKRFVILAAIFLLYSMSHAQDLKKDPPVKTWKEIKYVGNKPIEVLKVQLKSGKVVEIYPTIKEVPKPESALPKSKSKFLIIGLTILTGLITLILLIFRKLIFKV